MILYIIIYCMILINIEIDEYIKKRISRSIMDKFETNFSSIYTPNREHQMCNTIDCYVYISMCIYVCSSTTGLKQYKCQTVRRLN